MKAFISRIGSAALLAFPQLVYAQPLGNADDLDTGARNGGDLRGALVSVVQSVMTYVTLICVIMIIVAGLYLIFSLGNDSAKETAKKIIIYTIVGLLLIILSKAIIYFIFNVV